MMVPLASLLRLSNALTLAHLDLSAARRENGRLLTQVQDLQRQLEETKKSQIATIA